MGGPSLDFPRWEPRTSTGNRVAKTVITPSGATTTQYLVDDLNPTGLPQVVEEKVGGAVQRVYTYGLQRISQNQFFDNPGTPSFYVYDGAGSVRQLTDSTGKVTDEYEYDAYGNSFTKSGTTPNNYLYRGEQYDADLGLYYLRARYYNPNTGRFMSRDPEDGEIKIPTTLHKYLYAGGDPVNMVDPTGRNEEEDAEIEEDVEVVAAPVERKLGWELASYFLAAAAVVYEADKDMSLEKGAAGAALLIDCGLLWHGLGMM